MIPDPRSKDFKLYQRKLRANNCYFDIDAVEEGVVDKLWKWLGLDEETPPQRAIVDTIPSPQPLKVEGRENYSNFRIEEMHTWKMANSHNRVRNSQILRCKEAFGELSHYGASWDDFEDEEECSVPTGESETSLSV